MTPIGFIWFMIMIKVPVPHFVHKSAPPECRRCSRAFCTFSKRGVVSREYSRFCEAGPNSQDPAGHSLEPSAGAQVQILFPYSRQTFWLLVSPYSRQTFWFWPMRKCSSSHPEGRWHRDRGQCQQQGSFARPHRLPKIQEKFYHQHPFGRQA